MKLAEDMKNCAAQIDGFFETFFADEAREHRLADAMRYSTMSGGKRIRPYLTMKTAELLGADPAVALPFAAALELVHTYSLIHDDLPCMDDDDYRRGRLTCHKMFDEATAVLAGDALLTDAFSVLVNAPCTDRQKAEAVKVLAEAAGSRGMVAGQMTDLEAERHAISFDTLKRLYANKTGALMRASVLLGCIAADCRDASTRNAFVRYAENIGLTFQIVDDLLDKYGDCSLGKPLGSDEKNGKNTYLTFVSPEEAKADAERLTSDAKAAVSTIAGGEVLAELADMLLRRQK